MLARAVYLLHIKKGSTWGNFPEYDELVKKVGVKLSGKERRWEITRIRGIAQTNPVSRRILLDKKLFFRLDQDQREAVIIHELAHFALHHSFKTSLIFVTGCILSLVASLAGSLVIPFVLWFSFLAFTVFLRRNFEYEADLLAAKYVDSQHLIAVLQRTLDPNDKQTFISKMTHPSPRSRIAKLQAHAPNHSGDDDLLSKR